MDQYFSKDETFSRNYNINNTHYALSTLSNTNKLSKRELNDNIRDHALTKFDFISLFEKSIIISPKIMINDYKVNNLNKNEIRNTKNGKCLKKTKIIPKSESIINKKRKITTYLKYNNFYCTKKNTIAKGKIKDISINDKNSKAIFTYLEQNNYITKKYSPDISLNLSINNKASLITNNSKNNILNINNEGEKMLNINLKKNLIENKNKNDNNKNEANYLSAKKGLNMKKIYKTNKIEKKKVSKINLIKITKTRNLKINPINKSQISKTNKINNSNTKINENDDTERKSYKIINSEKRLNDALLNINQNNQKYKNNYSLNKQMINIPHLDISENNSNKEKSQNIETVKDDNDMKCLIINKSGEDDDILIPDENNYYLDNLNLKNSEKKNNYLKEYQNFERIRNINELINESMYWDLSSRNYYNVNLKINFDAPYKKEFKFINDIEIANSKLIILKISNFFKLKNYSMFHLLSFIYEYYTILIKINDFLAKKIVLSLKYVFSPVINDFKIKYNSILEVKDYYFINNKLISNKVHANTFNLIIVAKITTKNFNKSYEISCDYESNKKKYDYLWKFDIKKKKDITIWFDSEINYVKYNCKRFTYSSQVSSFSFNDEIQLIINIFSKECSLDPSSIKWSELNITNINNNNVDNYFYDKTSFDPLRNCEIEKQIIRWKNIKDNKKVIVKEFMYIFQKYFMINDLYYDKQKYYFYKFELVANKKGILRKNKLLSFDINIIDIDENLKNELQCIFLINSNTYFNKIDIRIGTKVTFYLSEMN